MVAAYSSEQRAKLAEHVELFRQSLARERNRETLGIVGDVARMVRIPPWPRFEGNRKQRRAAAAKFRKGG